MTAGGMTTERDGWRAATPEDLPAVGRVAAAVHPDYPEDDAVFAERLALFPDGCRVAVRAGRIVGYAFFHPGVVGSPPPLNTLLGALPAAADCLYIHDVALTADARGAGLGAALLEIAAAVAAARGLPTLALTATPAAAGYWRGAGFADRSAASEALAAYGDGMAYMVRAVRA